MMRKGIAEVQSGVGQASHIAGIIQFSPVILSLCSLGIAYTLWKGLPISFSFLFFSGAYGAISFGLGYFWAWKKSSERVATVQRLFLFSGYIWLPCFAVPPFVLVAGLQYLSVASLFYFGLIWIFRERIKERLRIDGSQMEKEK